MVPGRTERGALAPVPPGGAGSHVHPGMLDLLTRLTSTPAQVITDRGLAETRIQDIADPIHRRSP
mgnify:CR=1 FL=1